MRQPTQEQLAMQVGQTVTVTRDMGEIEVRTVKYDPWQLPNGAWLIGLNGIAGGYDLTRCEAMEKSGCDYQGHEFGAPYPDSFCKGGYLYDADSDNGSVGGDIPCPRCNVEAHAEYQQRMEDE